VDGAFGHRGVMSAVRWGVAVGLAAAACGAGEPVLAPGVKLQAGGQDIDIGIGHLVPCVADWNGDGRKDLLLGQFMEGRIRFYPNTGTDAQPAFRAFELLAAGGAPIRLDAG